MLFVYLLFAVMGTAFSVPCPDCEALCGCVLKKGKPAQIPLAKMQVAYAKCHQKYDSGEKGNKVDLEEYYRCRMPECGCMNQVNEKLNFQMSTKTLAYFDYRDQLAIAATEPVVNCVTKELGLTSRSFGLLRKQYQQIQDSYSSCYAKRCGSTFGLLRETTHQCAVKNGLLTSNEVAQKKRVIVPILTADQKTVTGSFNAVTGSSINFDQKTVIGSFNGVFGSNINFDQKTVVDSFNDVDNSGITFDQKFVDASFNNVAGSNIDFDQKTVIDSFNDVDDSSINFDQKTVQGSFNAVSGSSISFDQDGRERAHTV